MPKKLIIGIIVVVVLIVGGYFVFSVPDNEMFKQKSVGGPWHLWSFDETDFEMFLGGQGELKMEKETQGLVLTIIGIFKKT